MAFANGTIWENWDTGASTNGGGFDPTNASMATDLTTDANTANTASPVCSSATYNFAARDVGAWLFIQSGTNWTPGWYQIASVASNKATLTATIGTAVLYGTVSTGLNYHRPNGLITAAGCATVGTPTSGVWSIDYSQQAAAGIAYTDMASAGAGSTYSSILNPVGKNIVGNVLNVASGTNFTTGRFQVVSTSGTTATVDKAITTGVGALGTASLGGAYGADIKVLAFALVAGNKVFIKATGTYISTVTTTVTAAAKGDTTNGKIIVEGYTTYPGQQDGRPLITSATNSVALLTLNDNDYFEFVHLKFTHTAATRGNGITCTTSTSSPLWFKDCIFDGCLTAINGGGNSSIIHCEGVEVLNCTSSTSAILILGTLYLYGCDIHDNTGDAVRNTSGNTTVIYAQRSIFSKNAIAFNSVNTAATIAITAHYCIFVDQTSDGMKVASNASVSTFELSNNIFYNNGGYGIDNLDAQAEIDASVRINRNNAYGANTSGAYLAMAGGKGEITLTADPFTSRAGRDYSLNNTAGGGALLRSLGFPTQFPAGTTLNYLDVGAAQRNASAAAGGLLYIPNLDGI